MIFLFPETEAAQVYQEKCKFYFPYGIDVSLPVKETVRTRRRDIPCQLISLSNTLSHLAYLYSIKFASVSPPSDVEIQVV